MKQLLKAVVAGLVLSYMPAVMAAEWVSVTQNAAGDKFFVDKTSIQRTEDTAWFWEYREFPQPNNAFLETSVNQPLHGAVIQWSVDCSSKVQRLRQLVAYTTGRKLIQRFSYGDTGSLEQPRPGSSAHTVLNYVCDTNAQ